MSAHSRTILAIFAAATVFALAFPAGARAQVVMDDDDDVGAPPPPAAEPEDPNEAKFGVALRLRQTFIPKSILEAFVETSSGGHSNLGFGIEGIRRRGNLEISFGIEYESLEGDDGVWIDNDFDADYLEFDGLAWITGDFTFVWHTQLHDIISIRYGGGAGLGVITGRVLQTDQTCTQQDNAATCMDAPGAIPEENEDIPPVFPVVNILAGLQITPTDQIAINIEGGMRTLFYVGTSVAYYF